jgi:hypothetical protein
LTLEIGVNSLKPNISILNALCRITIGFTILAYASSKLTRRSCNFSVLFLIIMSAMRIGEGILRFCPMTALCKRCMVMMDKSEDVIEENVQPS